MPVIKNAQGDIVARFPYTDEGEREAQSFLSELNNNPLGEQYEIVSLIEPNINDLTLAEIETKFGNFDLAIKIKNLINLKMNTNVLCTKDVLQ